MYVKVIGNGITKVYFFPMAYISAMIMKEESINERGINVGTVYH